MPLKYSLNISGVVDGLFFCYDKSLMKCSCTGEISNSKRSIDSLTSKPYERYKFIEF